MSEVNNEYDIGNRLIRSNDKKFSYDDDGNQIQAGETSFDYMTSHVNSNNVKRLKSVYENEDHVASYSYTLEGLRTGKYLNEGQSEISYHYSGKNVQYEKWDDGRTVRYTHPAQSGSSCSSCGGCGNEKNVFTDHPISIEIDGSKYYYLYNGQGSVTELINADEEVANQYRYTPFGSPKLKAESVYNPYQYTGRRLDKETGQYFYRARMYSPQQSRFTTQDPAGMTDGPNMYAYVGNNPVNKRDPNGMVADDDEEPLPGGPGDAIIDGGGGESACPGATYDTFDDCVDTWTGATDDPNAKCWCKCYDECGDDGSGSGGGIDIALAEHSRVDVIKKMGIPYGYDFEFDVWASDSIARGAGWSASVVCPIIVSGNPASVVACVAVLATTVGFSYCVSKEMGTSVHYTIATGLINHHHCINY